MSKQLSSKELSVIYDNYKTKTHEEIGVMIGRSRHCVRNACSRFGWLTRDDSWSDEDLKALIDWYSRPASSGKDTLQLETLANTLGRLKSNVCRKAKSLGLTHGKRKVAKQETLDAMSTRQKDFIAVNGHPRGASGMKHSEDTKQIISKKSKDQWASAKARPLLLEVRRRQTVRTNVERYGTACPSQAANAGQNVYSRCKRGVREDIGIFVRSRWEANYARYLNLRKDKGEIASWEYEPMTFRFENVTRGPYTYKPDFKIVTSSGEVEWHEVKGWMDSSSRSKLKRFAKHYPNHKMVVVDAAAYRLISKSFSDAIPHWEA